MKKTSSCKGKIRWDDDSYVCSKDLLRGLKHVVLMNVLNTFKRSMLALGTSLAPGLMLTLLLKPMSPRYLR